MEMNLSPCASLTLNKWTSNDGQTHETTTWVDCVISGKPKVFESTLKKANLYISRAPVTLRVYSSGQGQDVCEKARYDRQCTCIELLGGKSDDVPSVLYTEDGQVEVKTRKCFAGEPNIDASGRPHAGYSYQSRESALVRMKWDGLHQYRMNHDKGL